MPQLYNFPPQTPAEKMAGSIAVVSVLCTDFEPQAQHYTKSFFVCFVVGSSA